MEERLCRRRFTGCFSPSGFSLLEFLLVLALIGFLLALILPRFQRATTASRFAEVRQQATEIASFINQWSEAQVQAQFSDTSFTHKDFLMERITTADNNFRSEPLYHRYTGNDNFNGVEKLISPDDIPRNPFNQASCFNAVNDDRETVPSLNPGLIYLTSFREKRGQRGDRGLRFFYLIFTGTDPDPRDHRLGSWYGGMDDELEAGIRRGVLVNRCPDIPYQSSRVFN
ncbi:MAG: prepilin-type N-terminal cleavage/methylation domain-containing protein [Deltaproteobacteria bacterium]|nr:prepilin-type N-terminal cleavage/methylation domain-containing protein [Deltaproteobacteria bacterium]